LYQKLHFSKIQSGGGRHEDICFNFGMLMDIDHTRLTVPKIPLVPKIKMVAAAIFDFNFCP